MKKISFIAFLLVFCFIFISCGIPKDTYNEALAQISTKESEYEKLFADYTTLLSDNDKLLIDLNKLESRNESLQNKFNILTGTYNLLKSDFDTIVLDKKSLETEYNNYKSKNVDWDRLSDADKSYCLQIIDKKKELTTLESTIQEKNKKITELSNIINDYNSKINNIPKNNASPINIVPPENTTLQPKKVNYSWEYPLSWYEWSYSLEIPTDVYQAYKSINRNDIYGYTYYVTESTDDEYLSSLANVFKRTADEEGFGEWDTIHLIISFVQHLDYVSDDIGTGYDEYPKFPLETLYDKGGDCEDSSILLASLLREMGYGVVLIAFDTHMGVGIKGGSDLPGYYFTGYGINYYYIETTSTGWEVGDMPEECIGKSASILYLI